MITISNLSLQRGQKHLLQAANVLIKARQKVGVVGKNGCGKSSFFKLILGILEPDQGEIRLPQQLSIAHVAQEMPNSQQSALDYVLAGDTDLQQLRQQLTQTQDGEKLALLHARLQEIDAYTAEARAGSLLHGLGFSSDEQQQSVESFSGGWRVRLNLAQALMCRSDLLLLDEPTNHLDLDAVLWLEKFLQQYKGTLLLISHDREFLDNVIDHTLHIEHQVCKRYTGNYSSFENQRAEQLALQQKQYEKQQQQIAHLQAFVDRFRVKASKAKQAQGRIKAIARMEKIAAAHVDSEFSFAFKPLQHLPDPLLTLEKATVGYNDKQVLQAVDMQLRKQGRVALLGPNGAGKSTLLKSLLGELPLLAGELRCSANLQVGYFAQHQLDLLDLPVSALLHLQRIDNKVSEKVGRQYLGSFGFSGDHALMPIRHFSGGEKARLVLALIIWQQPNLLLLDEPTNHFDIDMREALNFALQDYQGGLLVISHDRHLIRSCCDELWLVADGSCQRFDGDVDDYENWLLNRNNTTDNKKVTSKHNKKQQRQQRAKRQLMIKQKEKQLLQLEQTLASIAQQLAQPEIYQDTQKLKPLLAEQRQLQAQLQQLEHAWMVLQEAHEQAEDMLQSDD